MTPFLIVVLVILAVTVIILQWGRDRRFILPPSYFLPKGLAQRLTALGFETDNDRITWQEAILYLWEYEDVAIVIYPLVKEGDSYYDYDIMTDRGGAAWEEDTLFTTYEQAAQHALENAITDVEVFQKPVNVNIYE